MSSSAWFPLAQLLRPQGRRGELLADPLTNVDDAFSVGAQVWLAKTGEPATDGTPRVLEEFWEPTGRNAGRIVVKLSGVNSISEAEALEGLTLFLPASEAPELEDDTWFVADLIGCTLYDNGKPVGEIVDVEYAVGADGRTRLEDAAPLLAVETPGGEEALVPFVQVWIDAVDIQGKAVRMRLPQGLIGDVEE